MQDLSEVRSAIKAEFSNSLAQVDAPQLQLYSNSTGEQLIPDFDEITSENTPQH